MGLIVNSIGDAACISLFNDTTNSALNTNCNNNCLKDINECNFANLCSKNKFNELDTINSIDLVVDYGKYTSATAKQIEKSNNFLLTHFHLDHYRGFGKKDKNHTFYYSNNPFQFNNFYYQSLPLFDDFETHKHTACLLSIGNIFDIVLGFDGELYASFRQDIAHSVRNISVCCHRGSIGPVIAGGYEVIWPLYSLRARDFTRDLNINGYIEYLENKINNMYNTALQYPIIKRCEGIFNEHCIVYEDKTEKSGDERKIDLFKSIGKFCSLIFAEERYLGMRRAIFEFISTGDRRCRDIRNEMRNLANHFSVCLYKKGEFLSLGDLENEDINPCVLHFLTTHHLQEVNVRYFITAHHGTHWDTECRSIKADYVISSNGSRMKKHFKCNYLSSLKTYQNDSSKFNSQKLHNTYCKGDIVDL